MYMYIHLQSLIMHHRQWCAPTLYKCFFVHVFMSAWWTSWHKWLLPVLLSYDMLSNAGVDLCSLFLKGLHCHHCLLGGTVACHSDCIRSSYSCVVLKDSQTETEMLSHHYVVHAALLFLLSFFFSLPPNEPLHYSSYFQDTFRLSHPWWPYPLCWPHPLSHPHPL